jgi:hypothetical protein
VSTCVHASIIIVIFQSRCGESRHRQPGSDVGDATKCRHLDPALSDDRDSRRRLYAPVLTSAVTNRARS